MKYPISSLTMNQDL